MIQREAIDQAILECMAEENPNAWTMLRLASQYIVKAFMFSDTGSAPVPEALKSVLNGASFAAAPAPPTSPPDEIVSFGGKTEFAKRIDGKKAAEVWAIMDELMSILRTIYPELYTEVLKKLPE